jgi:hypothetical protein
MIEALVDYIRQKGYTVGVLTGRLLFKKQVTVRGEERVFGYGWVIDPRDLNQIPKEWFFHQADRYMAEIEQAIQDEQQKVEELCAN